MVVDLSQYSSWKIGGICKHYLLVNTVDELSDIVRQHRTLDTKYIVIGESTNILFDSRGVDCTIVKLGGSFNKVKYHRNNRRIRVGAGAWVPRLVADLCRKGYSGLEHAIGIPASFGGLICMNGGSNRRNIGEVIHSVTHMYPSGYIHELRFSECGFAYRKSNFQSIYNNNIILYADLNLEFLGKGVNRNHLIKTLAVRNAKFPRKEPNCGSVFKSNIELYESLGPPGKIIESLGLKGYTIGGAQISTMHANFIVNKGDATSRNVGDLVRLIQNKVINRYGIKLESEIQFVTKNGDILPLEDAM